MSGIMARMSPNASAGSAVRVIWRHRQVARIEGDELKRPGLAAGASPGAATIPD